MAAVSITVNSAATEVEAGTTAGEALKAAGVKDTAVARVDGELRDLAHVARRGRGRRGRAVRERGRPRGAAALRRPRAGPGRPGAVPRHAAGHRAAGQGRLLLRLPAGAAVHARGPRGHREEDERHHAAAAAVQPPRRRRGRGPRRAGAREVQARADRAQGQGRLGGVRRGRRPRADDLRQPARRRGGLGRPVPWPAPADHPRRPGLQDHAQRGRVLARRPGQRAAAAHLRHRVGVQGRPEGVPDHARGGREARPPPPRRRAGPVLLPRRARLRAAGVPPQGRGGQARDGGLRPPAPPAGGLRLRRDPAHLEGGALPHLRATSRTTPTACSRPWRWRARLLPQGHELPDAQPDLPQPRTLLPRAAAAVLRVRLGVPQREVRGGARPHPRPRA